MLADRIRQLMNDNSVSAFARKTGLSESLVRKYLNGSDPSLSRAQQIAEKNNVSLSWLATGVGNIKDDESLLRAAMEKTLSLSDYEIDKVFQAYLLLKQQEQQEQNETPANIGTS